MVLVSTIVNSLFRYMKYGALMINFNFFDEWLLLKSNVKNLFLNQRLTRFPYLIGVLFLLLEVYIGNLINLLGIVDSLKLTPNDTFSNYFGRIVLTSDYYIDEPIFFIMTIVINLLGAFTLSELGKRRLNDYSGSALGRCLQYIILIFNILLLGFWGYNQNLTDIDLRVTVDFYIYLFYEYIVLLLLIFVPSNKESNRYGLPNGKQKSGEYNISYEPLYSSSGDKKREDYWDRIGLSHSIDSFRTMFINKLFDYRTRAKRQELYWGVVMFQILTNALNPILFYFYENIFNIDTAIVASLVIYWIFWLWYMLANISCTVRRLHDTGLSGYWLVAMFIPFINIYTLYMTVFKPSINRVELNSINE